MSRSLIYLTGIVIALAFSIAQAEAGSFVFYTNAPRHHGGHYSHYSPFPSFGYSLYSPSSPHIRRAHCNPYRKVRVYDHDWTGHRNPDFHGHHDRYYGGYNTPYWGWR